MREGDEGMDIVRGIKGFLAGNFFLSAIRMLLGLMFLYSGFFKVLDPVSFGRVISAYGLLPGPMVPYAALTVSMLEMVLGVLLLTGTWIRPAAAVSILLMLAFSAAISINLIRGNEFDCGCFELSRFGINERISIWLVLRDLAMAAGFLIVHNARRHPISLESFIEKRRLREL